jgi:hypothetical protein
MDQVGGYNCTVGSVICKSKTGIVSSTVGGGQELSHFGGQN